MIHCSGNLSVHQCETTTAFIAPRSESHTFHAMALPSAFWYAHRNAKHTVPRAWLSTMENTQNALPACHRGASPPMVQPHFHSDMQACWCPPQSSRLGGSAYVRPSPVRGPQRWRVPCRRQRGEIKCHRWYRPTEGLPTLRHMAGVQARVLPHAN